MGSDLSNYNERPHSSVSDKTKKLQENRMKVSSIIPILMLGLCCVIFTGAGCSSSAPVIKNGFKLTTMEGRIKPGSIAVICGNASEIDIQLASEITRILKEKTTLTVMPQREIEERVKCYPANFMEPQNTNSDQLSSNQDLLTEGNAKALSQMQRQLGVDYILLVWMKNMYFQKIDNSCSISCCCVNILGPPRENYYITVPTRLISFPSREVIGFSNSVYKKWMNTESTNKDIHAFITYTAETIVSHMSESLSIKIKEYHIDISQDKN
jgi:hypothetical protein